MVHSIVCSQSNILKGKHLSKSLCFIVFRIKDKVNSSQQDCPTWCLTTLTVFSLFMIFHVLKPPSFLNAPPPLALRLMIYIADSCMPLGVRNET